jgi:hypothetical protein
MYGWRSGDCFCNSVGCKWGGSSPIFNGVGLVRHRITSSTTLIESWGCLDISWYACQIWAKKLTIICIYAPRGERLTIIRTTNRSKSLTIPLSIHSANPSLRQIFTRLGVLASSNGWRFESLAFEDMSVGCTNRISVGINDRILTQDLSTINEGIPLGYIDQW